jgi:hypothetical protein
MTIRHGVSAALLMMAGLGWAVNPPPPSFGRRFAVPGVCIALGVGSLAVGAWVARRPGHS